MGHTLKGRPRAACRATVGILCSERSNQPDIPQRLESANWSGELKKKDYIIDLYKHEQRENTSLIGEYEDGVGTMAEQIRNYCLGIDKRFLDQKRHYNNLLQQEKDDHLASRLEKDEYFAQVLKLSGQIRHAYRLRTDEWCDEFRVVAALQTQVRCLRRVAGWDPEKVSGKDSSVSSSFRLLVLTFCLARGGSRMGISQGLPAQ